MRVAAATRPVTWPRRRNRGRWAPRSREPLPHARCCSNAAGHSARRRNNAPMGPVIARASAAYLAAATRPVAWKVAAPPSRCGRLLRKPGRMHVAAATRPAPPTEPPATHRRAPRSREPRLHARCCSNAAGHPAQAPQPRPMGPEIASLCRMHVAAATRPVPRPGAATAADGPRDRARRGRVHVAAATRSVPRAGAATAADGPRDRASLGRMRVAAATRPVAGKVAAPPRRCGRLLRKPGRMHVAAATRPAPQRSPQQRTDGPRNLTSLGRIHVAAATRSVLRAGAATAADARDRASLGRVHVAAATWPVRRTGLSATHRGLVLARASAACALLQQRGRCPQRSPSNAPMGLKSHEPRPDSRCCSNAVGAPGRRRNRGPMREIARASAACTLLQQRGRCPGQAPQPRPTGPVIARASAACVLLQQRGRRPGQAPAATHRWAP